MSTRLTEHDRKNLREFGQLIKGTREKMNLSQEKLAECANVNRRTIGRIETGTGNPTCSTILRVLSGLNVSHHDIFMNVPDEQKESLHSILIALEDFDPDSLKYLKRIVQTLQIILSYIK